ncbi:MAG: carboxylating nicotinate-nucleotide diphosphorylase, partial [Candidatus Latescibacterota bacterium]
ITTDSIVPPELVSTAFLFSKARGVLAGIDVFVRVFQRLDSCLDVKTFYQDGQDLLEGHKVAEITGPVVSILKAERTALNFLGRMSGIATKTHQYAELVKGCNVKILDTRKTMPTMRHLDKYAVRMGGGTNHRFGLFDMVLIKDNHIAVAGGIRIAVERVTEQLGDRRQKIKIEVECKSYDEVLEAIYLPVDIIMLDNMDIGEIERSAGVARKVAIETGKRVRLEVSGNITVRNVRAVAETGVDFISVGALTHSAPSYDFSLLFGEL